MTAAPVNTTTPATALCDHCSLPVPAGLVDRAATRQFCCQGCRTVYEMIHANGLEDYYRVRESLATPSMQASVKQQSYAAYDSESFLQKHCERLSEDRAMVDLRLEGVHCAACLWLVERLPKFIAGVETSRLSLRDATVRITWAPSKVALSEIAKGLNRLGYPPQPARETTARDMRRRHERRQLARIGVAGACAGNCMLIAVALYAGDFSSIEANYANLFRWLSMAIGLVALLWPGGVFFRGALVALRTRTANLDVPIALALGTGGIVGVYNVLTGYGDIYFDSLSTLVFLLLVGRWFQARQQRWADEAVSLLHQFTPTSCRLVADTGVIETTIDAITPGDVVEILSGDIIPADGRVVDGQSSINCSLLTGESQAVRIQSGSAVYAGMQNIGGCLRVEVTKLGKDARIGRLMALVAKGVAEKPPLVQLTDRAAGWFVMAVVSIATLTFAIWSLRVNIEVATNHTVALLIVACPCALGLATPLTLAVAIGRAARQNILIKNATAIELLASQGRILIDKTGTLTHGQPQVIDWIGDTRLQPVVARIESQSTHPIAKSLTAEYCDIPFPPDFSLPKNLEEYGDGGVQATSGSHTIHIGSLDYLERLGISLSPSQRNTADEHLSLGRTIVGVAMDRQMEAIASLGDALRSDSSQAIQQISERGWQTTIVSGDAPSVVQRVANQIGLPSKQAIGAMSPEDKLSMVSESVHDHEVTVMVGDGVNDAAALAAADIGIAVHGGAEASMAAADVYVATPGLEPIVWVMNLAVQTLRTTRQNIAIALGYNSLAITLAAFGLVTPLVAAVLMPISSAVLLTNAMSVSYRSIQ